MTFPLEQNRLESLLALLPGVPGAERLSADYFAGWLCGALCVLGAEEPVGAMDAHWGESWSEALMEQELLDEFMGGVEEYWQLLQERLDGAVLTQDPDALPVADALPWAHHLPDRPASSGGVPEAARAWASGFVDAARDQTLGHEAAELLAVVRALTLGPGATLQAYLQQAYDEPLRIPVAALIDDALYAAQDLRILTQGQAR
ncbi:hypothetical protein QRD43_16745 [Pelomonas sp. APW6]|uniref:YecA family protein n=1 Tax=Roseateles subflavus TaxID=3053353 RepID=A0ABT7LM69_9BURK|nr:hypothetical protein [Pelomonas sp. APW6]MDL5033564.1 hypothetical protein [Pelomonas sp. APW6]